MVEFNSSYMSKLILEYNKKNYLNNKTKGCNIALYGAGYFGKLCYNQIKNNNLYNVIGWYDKKFSEIKSVMGVNILDPEQIKNDEFVYIVITIKSKIVCDEIIEFLKNKGISEGKIVCI
jgi:FlaA1/EpsC-like NDP-sugar epimerase